MKKRIATMVLLLLCASLAACGEKEETPVTGGWTLTAGETAVQLPEEAQDAFDKASDSKLTPIALVSEQMVAGKNYLVLCTEDGAYRMAVLYRDLQGNAQLTNTADFDLGNYTQGESAAPAELMPGGWYGPDETTVLPLPEDARKAFDKAMEDLDGSSVEPMALLGTQVVAGTNYAVLCRVTPVTPDAVSTVQVAVVYADLQGGASFRSFVLIDPADFNN